MFWHSPEWLPCYNCHLPNTPPAITSFRWCSASKPKSFSPRQLPTFPPALQTFYILFTLVTSKKLEGVAGAPYLYCRFTRLLVASHFEKCEPENQLMRLIISAVFVLSFCTFVMGQGIPRTEWYSETTSEGVVIQNSFPKGGPYTGPTKKNFNYSYLVFFTRVVNNTVTPLELTINFSADSIEIPNSPDTFVKLFLPADTMTLDKQSLFYYGVTELESFDKPTRFERTISPNEECLFYVVAIFYQTKATEQNQQRGGNRAELVLKGQDLFYRMPPQIDSLPCGHIISRK